MNFLYICIGYLLVSIIIILIYVFGLLNNSMPQPVERLFRAYTPTRLKIFYDEVYTYILFTRNHIFQSIYIILVLSGHAVIFIDILPILYTTRPGINHTTTFSLCLAANGICFILSCFSNPGIITTSAKRIFAKTYKYDNVLYTPNRICTTCDVPRLPRAKHCAIYNKCIHRFDHFCVWTNNCVGGLNARYFLLYLLTTCAMVINAVILSAHALHDVAGHLQLWSLHYVDGQGQPHPMDFTTLVQTLFMRYPRIVLLASSISLIAIGLIAFTTYHVFLLLTNQTTNERYKKYRLAKEHKLETLENFYNRGVIANILEVIFPMRNNDTKDASAHIKEPIYLQDQRAAFARFGNAKQRKHQT